MYGVLDLIRDVGGLSFGLNFVATSILSLIVFLGDYQLPVYLVSKIFREPFLKKHGKGEDDSESKSNQHKAEYESTFRAIRLNRFQIPFFKDKKQMRILKVGGQRIDKDLDIARFLVK